MDNPTFKTPGIYVSSAALQNNSYFYWFPVGYNPEKNKFFHLTGLFSCKDYIIDYYNQNEVNLLTGEEYTSYDAVKNGMYSEWKEEDKKTHNHIAINRAPTLLANVEKLQKLEESFGATPCVLHDYEQDGFFILTYDPIWQTTTGLLSLYLSIVRQTLKTGDVDLSTTGGNERSYYNSLNGDNKAFYQYMFRHPLEYLKHYDIKVFTPLGLHPTFNGVPGHGMTGPYNTLYYNTHFSVFNQWKKVWVAEKKKLQEEQEKQYKLKQQKLMMDELKLMAQFDKATAKAVTRNKTATTGVRKPRLKKAA